MKRHNNKKYYLHYVVGSSRNEEKKPTNRMDGIITQLNESSTMLTSLWRRAEWTRIKGARENKGPCACAQARTLIQQNLYMYTNQVYRRTYQYILI